MDSDFIPTSTPNLPTMCTESEFDNIKQYLGYYSLSQIKPEILDAFYDKMNKISAKFNDDKKRRQEVWRELGSHILKPEYQYYPKYPKIADEASLALSMATTCDV